jgi:hypothetical protein
MRSISRAGPLRGYVVRDTDIGIAINVVLSALVIGVAAWLSGRFPRAAGFLVSLPLATMLVWPMAHLQHQDAERTVAFATSILIAVPVVMLFLRPLMLAAQWGCPSGSRMGSRVSG